MTVVALLTDFGVSDPFVGIMKGVILSVAPATTLIDLTHDVPSYDVALGAWHLGNAAPYLPAGTIILAVVDPGVGTARRPVAVQAGGRIFVAPDNGLLSGALARAAPVGAVTLDQPAFWRTPSPSGTFHGRDIFAPVAGHLARGVPPLTVGTAIDPASLIRLAPSAPEPQPDGSYQAHVLAVDHFGNVITDIGPDLAAALFAADQITATVGGQIVTARAPTFGSGPLGEPFWYPDSSGHAALALRDGHAAALLGARPGDLIRVAW